MVSRPNILYYIDWYDLYASCKFKVVYILSINYDMYEILLSRRNVLNDTAHSVMSDIFIVKIITINRRYMLLLVQCTYYNIMILESYVLQ